MGRNEQNLGNLWNIIKQPDMRGIGSFKGEERENAAAKKMFEEIMAEYIPNLMKNINLEFQQCLGNLSKINTLKKPHLDTL